MFKVYIIINQIIYTIFSVCECIQMYNSTRHFRLSLLSMQLGGQCHWSGHLLLFVGVKRLLLIIAITIGVEIYILFILYNVYNRCQKTRKKTTREWLCGGSRGGLRRNIRRTDFDRILNCWKWSMASILRAAAMSSDQEVKML